MISKYYLDGEYLQFSVSHSYQSNDTLYLSLVVSVSAGYTTYLYNDVGILQIPVSPCGEEGTFYPSDTRYRYYERPSPETLQRYFNNVEDNDYDSSA